MNNEKLIKLPKQVEEITSQLDNIEQIKADKTELSSLADEVLNLALGGTSLKSVVESYDYYFSLAEKENDCFYYLSDTKENALTSYIRKQKPSLSVYNNTFTPIKGKPLEKNLRFWCDSKYKNNVDNKKDVFNDITGNNINGKLINFTYQNNGWSNDGLIFDSALNSKVEFPNIPFNTNGFTAEIMYYYDSQNTPNGTRIINTSSSSISLYKYNSLNFAFKFEGWERPLVPISKMKLDEYNFFQVAVDYTIGVAKVYLNGEFISMTSNEPIQYNKTLNLYIGAFDELNPFVGKCKMIRFYDRSLAQSELISNYEYEIKKYIESNESTQTGNIITSDDGKKYLYYLTIENGNLKINFKEVL